MKKLLIISVLLGSTAYAPVYAAQTWLEYKQKNTERFNLSREERIARDVRHSRFGEVEDSFYQRMPTKQLRQRRKMYKSMYQDLTLSATPQIDGIPLDPSQRSYEFGNDADDMHIKAAWQLYYKQRVKHIKRIIRERLGKPIPDRLRDE